MAEEELTVPDPAFAPLLIGQVVEWLVWGELVARSSGDVRVFLPTRDMGVDGVVLRHSTEQMVPVQVKGRSRLEDGILRVHVQEHDVRDPRAVIVVAVVDLASNALREPVFVVSAAALRERARLISWGGRPAYAVEIPYPPGQVTRWAPLACGLDELPARVVPGARAGVAWAEGAGLEAMPEAADQEALATTGYVGEIALVHHAALVADLNVFHAAPDTGFVEYIVRNVTTNVMRGYQVKCVETTRGAHAVHIPRRTMSRLPENRLIVFMRARDGDVGSPCLLIPAPEIAELARPMGDGRLAMWVDQARLGKLAPYAVSLDDLPARLAT